MEEEAAEDWPSEAAEALEGPGRETSSSTALEVEEDIVQPPSTATEGGDEETVLPRSSTLEGPSGGTPSLPSSEGTDSGSERPRAQSESRKSTGDPRSSSSSSSSSEPPEPPTSPFSWKVRQAGLQALEEEDGPEASDETAAEPDPSASAALETGPGAPRKGKKAPAKKGAPSYVGRPVVPAEKAELVSVAKAMHREDFGKNVKALFHLEKQAALKSMETGLYIGWRCPEYLWDCFRVADESKCFCGHLLKRHQVCVERRATVPCTQPECKCQSFTFVPSRPEEVGEFWLQRRTGFEAAAWRAKCRCKHTHEEHTPTGARACCARGCSCMAFASNFLCAACDRRWEEHETFFESEETRRKGGRPCGPRRLVEEKDDKKA